MRGIGIMAKRLPTALQIKKLEDRFCDLNPQCQVGVTLSNRKRMRGKRDFFCTDPLRTEEQGLQDHAGREKTECSITHV